MSSSRAPAVEHVKLGNQGVMVEPGSPNERAYLFWWEGMIGRSGAQQVPLFSPTTLWVRYLTHPLSKALSPHFHGSHVDCPLVIPCCGFTEK